MAKFNKFVCSVCGYIYDEEKGISEQNINKHTAWKDVPENWICPLCGAAKDAFTQQVADKKATVAADDIVYNNDKDLGNEEISVICSNYAKGAEKQYLKEEAEIFAELSKYFFEKGKEEKGSFEDLLKFTQEDISSILPKANALAQKEVDRGAMRAVVWDEKTTKMLSSLIKSYIAKGKDYFEEKLFLCQICGFVYRGESAPDVCPVCKVPNQKIAEIKGRG